MNLQSLVNIDELQKLSNPSNLPAYIHKEHRFCLPLLFEHQTNGDLPTPCNLILFDLHHDLAFLHSELMDELKRMRANSFTLEHLLEITNDVFRRDDSDWILAGIELGMIKDVVSFGVQHMGEWDQSNSYEDHRGEKHHIELLCCMPGELLSLQGALSDVARKSELSRLWDVLQWKLIPKQGFQFGTQREKFWLNIDLDCFVMNWRGFQFAWLDEVFLEYFEKPSDYWSTHGWTGKQFFNELIEAAGLLTIAKEPFYCGGEENAKEVFSKVNQYIFDNGLEITPFEI